MKDFAHLEVKTQDGRWGRIFARTSDECAKWQVRFNDSYMEEGDAARVPELRNLITRGPIEAVVHPGIEHTDVFRVYMHHPLTKKDVFAFVAIPYGRLDKILDESPTVFENFSSQFVNEHALHGTLDAFIEEAMRLWTVRNFDGLKPLGIAVRKG